MGKGSGYNPAAVEPVVQMKHSGVGILWFYPTRQTDKPKVPDQPLRVTHNFDIEGAPEYLKKHGGGLGGSFQNISQLPGDFESTRKDF